MNRVVYAFPQKKDGMTKLVIYLDGAKNEFYVYDAYDAEVIAAFWAWVKGQEKEYSE